MYLDRLVGEDIHFHTYVDHRETYPFDDIALYSGLLTYSSRMTYPYLPERIMRQFGYMQYIFKDPFMPAPPAMTRKDMNVMFDDYLNHMVPKET